MGTGLDLSSFLNHNKDGGGSRKFHNWKDKGSTVVWLSTRAAPAYPSWNHPFNYTGTYEDKKTGEEKETLKFTRFASPDPEIVHMSQFFRDDRDRLKIPPRLDPFLLLREWLRFADHIPLDAVVFEWDHPEQGRIQWRRGHLARLVDRGKKFWGSSIDTKLEYLFVVVVNDDPGEGIQIVRNSKLIGDSMKKTISQEMQSNGDKGNPLMHPYAFRWTYEDKVRNPMDSYAAFRFNAATLTDEIRELITSDDFPDPSADCKPRPGDKAKIRAAMEDATQIELPWDLLFVKEWEDDGPAEEDKAADDTSFDFGGNVETKRETKRTPEVSTSEGGEPKTRRKKKQEPEKEPEVERIPCDDCGYKMLPTDTKCANCGAEYEVEPADGIAAQEPEKPAVSKPASSTSKPSTSPADKCWSCGGQVKGDKCADCGLDVTDNLPYS